MFAIKGNRNKYNQVHYDKCDFVFVKNVSSLFQLKGELCTHQSRLTRDEENAYVKNSCVKLFVAPERGV